MSERTERLNSYFQQQFSELILKHVELPLTCLVSVTRVRITDQLDHGTVFISVIPANMEAKVIEILKQDWREVVHLAALRSKLYRFPHMVFEIDRDVVKTRVVEDIITTLRKEEITPSPKKRLVQKKKVVKLKKTLTKTTGKKKIKIKSNKKLVTKKKGVVKKKKSSRKSR